jgi:hypothetical protein
MAGAGYKLFVNGNTLSASDLNTYVQQQTVMVFASTAARTTALASVLAEGMVSYRTDSHVFEIYNGSAWVGAGTTSPLTTKGDLWSYSTTDARLGVGSDGYILTADSTQATGIKWAAAAGGGSMNEQIFTSSGTWTAPTGVTKAQVLIVSGGGSGGATSYNPGIGFGGMGGSQYTAQFTVTPGTGYTVTVGAGGAATTASANYQHGNTGSPSVFGSTSIAGGNGGFASDVTSGYTGGAPGSSSYGQGGSRAGTGGNGNAAGANTGGGGSGALKYDGACYSGAGGSGIVIVRWLA